jgi:hypothetical protein
MWQTFCGGGRDRAQDNSGSLDRDEVREMLVKLCQPPTEEELDIIMGQVDVDGNGEVDLGLGRIVALYYRSSALYRIHEHIRCIPF